MAPRRVVPQVSFGSNTPAFKLAALIKRSLCTALETYRKKGIRVLELVDMAETCKMAEISGVPFLL